MFCFNLIFTLSILSANQMTLTYNECFQKCVKKFWCIHICIDKQCKEVSSAVMALTVMYNKAHCEISILSLSLFTLLKSLTFQLTTERLKKLDWVAHY